MNQPEIDKMMRRKVEVEMSVIKTLNPCQDRLDNYIKYYSNRTFTRAQFMGLKNITHDDKVWVAFRLMPTENRAKAAADIAESVLHLYESKYPHDNRPRKAIEAVRSGTVTAEIRNDAYDAYDYDSDTSDAASDAAYAAYASTYDAYVYAYAYTYDASDACAVRSVRASSDKPNQAKLIRKILLKYWKDSK